MKIYKKLIYRMTLLANEYYCCGFPVGTRKAALEEKLLHLTPNFCKI